MSRFSDVFLDDVRTRLPIHELVGEYVIWDKRKSQPGRGDYWACCPFHGEKSPSFHADDRKGIYKCFGCGKTGDCYRFLVEQVGMTFPQAVERCASMAGIPMPEGVGKESAEERATRERQLERDREEMKRRHAESEKQREAEAAGKTANAIDIWKVSQPLARTLGEAYLIARGLAPVDMWPWVPDDCIRFHPGLVSQLDRDAGAFPAIVCKVVDPFGIHTAIWQIFLDRKRPTKAPLENPKVGRGPSAGGAIRIGGDAPDVDVSEGMETALAAWELQAYRRPSWSLMSASFMANWEPPPFITRVRTNPDGDRGKLTREGVLLDPAGITAATTLHHRLVSAGITNPINATSRHGDQLDLLVARKRAEGLLPGVSHGASH